MGEQPVVVGVDASGSARIAEEWAADLAAGWDVPLHLVHVAGEPAPLEPPAWLANLAAAVERIGARCTVDVVHGQVGAVLVERSARATDGRPELSPELQEETLARLQRPLVDDREVVKWFEVRHSPCCASRETNGQSPCGQPVESRERLVAIYRCLARVHPSHDLLEDCCVVADLACEERARVPGQH